MYDLYKLQKGDNITFDVQSSGNGILFVGFTEYKDFSGDVHLSDGDFYGDRARKVNSTLTEYCDAGEFYLFVRNNGNGTMKDIKGTVSIGK